MEKFVRLRKIKKCTLSLSNSGWHYEIMHLPKNSTYRADLWGCDDHHGYLAQSMIQESSPEFATEEEAENYAIQEWVA